MDLNWFITRYPLEIKSGAERLQARARKFEERISLVDEMLSGKRLPPEMPLAEPARNYQLIAASMLLNTGGLLLADDVGTGKTVSAICTFTDQRTLPVIVVTLTHLPPQWKDEINRFAPHLRVHIIKKGTPYNILEEKGSNPLFSPKRIPDVIIINYHKLSGWADTLAPIANSIIYDECQELRHDESQKYKSAKFLSDNVNYRMGLSATPIYNYGGEIYNVMNCLRPDALGTKAEFLSEWCTDTWNAGKEKIKDPFAFGTYMRESGLMLRRTRADIGRELPGITSIPYHIDADENAIARVKGSCAELAKIILSQNEEYRGQKMQASEELSNLLRQATGIAKASYVAEFVKLLVESGEQIVLYGWHREVYSIWLQELMEFNPMMYTGSESITQKEYSKAQFLSGQSKILIISLRSGAGLDGLQKVCRTAVFGEIDWSPGVHEQCIGRIGRDGQTEKVMAYFLLSQHGSDPVMAETLGLKKQQIDGIRNESQELFTKLQGDGGHIKKLAALYLEKNKTEE